MCLVCCAAAWAGPGVPPAGVEVLPDRMSLLALQVGVMLLAAWAGGRVFIRMHLPPTLGEIVAGVLIGPWMLGGVTLPVIGTRLFAGSLSPELAALAMVAAVFLLFFMGLRTDLSRLINYSVPGALAGLCGAAASLVLCATAVALGMTVVFRNHMDMLDPAPLFMGVVATATSAAVASGALLKRRKVETPEGAAILSGSLFDDGLAVIALVAVSVLARGEGIASSTVLWVSVLALGLWLAFSLVGQKWMRRVGDWMRGCRDRATVTVLCLGLALVLSGLFGLHLGALIVGGYVLGLSLSRTDLVHRIQGQLNLLHRFWMPLFFCVMGMVLDPRCLLQPRVLALAGLFTGAAVAAEIAGSGVLGLAGFTPAGALRVGVGLVPRGELALVMALLGLAGGILDAPLYASAVIMVFLSTIGTALVFERLLGGSTPALRAKASEEQPAEEEVAFTIHNPPMQELVHGKIIAALENDGFFVAMPDLDETLFRIRKGATVLTLSLTESQIVFRCRPADVAFVHLLFYEVLGEMEDLMRNLRSLSGREEMGRMLQAHQVPEAGPVRGSPFGRLVVPEVCEFNLRCDTKPEILDELLDILIRAGRVKESARDEILGLLLERESKISTGLQHGVALPHAKTPDVQELMCAVGIKREGTDFDSLDTLPTQIFVLTLAPARAAQSQLQMMAQVSRFLSRGENRERLLACQTNSDLVRVLAEAF